MYKRQVPGIAKALIASSARVIYVANLRPQEPETARFTLDDHLDALTAHDVRPDLVLVDAASQFASQPCSLERRLADLTSANDLVHDVQKLAAAIMTQMR